VNTFSRIPDCIGATLKLLSQEAHYIILDELKAPGGEKFFESFSQKVEALMPESTFHSNAATSQNQASPILDPFKLTLYLVSNNFFGTTSDVRDKIYKWVKHYSDNGLMPYLLSAGGPTIEALGENLFRMAIDAQDAPTVKKMMDLGIDPNEKAYFDRWGAYRTPLQQACWLRSLELVRVLIDGGAKVDLWAGENEAESALMMALCRSNENGIRMRRADTELVRILLHAGAIVNPGFAESPLAYAAKSGQAEVVGLLVSAGADVHFTKRCSRKTPLTYAVSCKNHISERDVISMARILLEAGADPQAKYREKSRYRTRKPDVTVLQAAMHRKSIELIQMLLDKGARVTEPAFVMATKYCDINITKLLLTFGGQVTEKVIGSAVQNDDPKMFTFLLEATDEKTKIRGENAAFIEALEHGKWDLIDWLAAEGARLERNFDPDSVIHKAIGRGDLRVLRLLLNEKSRFRDNCLGSMGFQLRSAIEAGRNDIAEILLTSGADFTTKNMPDHEPLSVAIRLKNLHLVRKLLAAGIPMDETTFCPCCCRPRKTSVLPAVIDWGYFPLIQEMIDAGADVNAPEIAGGKTSLSIAVENKNSAIVELLLNAGADINAPLATSCGNTALEAACRNNDLHMVQKLLDLGAEPDEWSLVAAISGSIEIAQTILAARLNRYKRFSEGFGCRALQHAIRLGNAAMIEMLLINGIDANTVIQYNNKDGDLGECVQARAESALGSAIKTDKSNDFWIIKMLLHGGADPNGVVGDRKTALVAAIDQNSLPLVQILIAAGADANPSVVPGFRYTPLQLAAEKGHIHIVKLLLAHGANVNAPPYDRYGATALQFAAIRGYVGLANLLLENGADVNAPPAKIAGRTALEGAAEHGRIDMLQLLLSAGAEIIGPGSEQYENARELALENGHVSARRLLEKYKIEISEDIVPWNPISVEFGSLDPESMPPGFFDEFRF
jgi:ankyrin repeat protein